MQKIRTKIIEIEENKLTHLREIINSYKAISDSIREGNNILMYQKELRERLTKLEY